MFCSPMLVEGEDGVTRVSLEEMNCTEEAQNDPFGLRKHQPRSLFLMD